MSEKISGRDTLNVAVIQADLLWEDPTGNIEFFESELDKIQKDSNLVVLPETFTTGFTMNAKQFAEGDNSTLDWMKYQASKHTVFLAGSCIIREGDRYYNRLLWVGPDGTSNYYDKRHLFRMGGERDAFSQGNRRVLVEAMGFRILLQICYDLRFPVFARNRGDYDIILYVANWPSSRSHVWDTLLVARAMENQAYVIGANRCGIDGMGDGTSGGSAVIDPKGQKISRLDDQPGILYASLSLPELRAFREKFPAQEDRDSFTIEGID